jgi:hypothetical protein
VRSVELRSRAFSRSELLERLVVAAAAGQQKTGHDVGEHPDTGPSVCLHGPCGALQPSLGFVELTRPGQVGSQRYQRWCGDGIRAPAVPVSERYRLAAAPSGNGERAELGRETELRQTGDFQVGAADLPGQGGALLEMTFSVRKPLGPLLDDPQVHQRDRPQVAAERDVLGRRPG